MVDALIQRYPTVMAYPNTTPTVITDRNGRLTMVHRKNKGPAAGRADFRSIEELRFSDGKAAPRELDELADVLLDRAQSWGRSKESRALEHQAINAVRDRQLDTLRALEAFATENRNADHIAEACLLLRETGEKPDAYLTERHIDAVMHIQDALELWEKKHDNYMGDDIDRRSEGREAFILYVLKDPSRDVLLDQALRRGVADLRGVMDYEEANRDLHRGIIDGSL